MFSGKQHVKKNGALSDPLVTLFRPRKNERQRDVTTTTTLTESETLRKYLHIPSRGSFIYWACGDGQGEERRITIGEKIIPYIV